MRVVVDGMGGDHSPQEIVKGCVLAHNEYGVDIAITGDKAAINNELSKYEYNKDGIVVIPTTEVISPNEAPVMAVRRKKDSSLTRALYMVKEKEADAIVSAGSTGAFLAGALLIVGRIKGVDRPALAPVMPGRRGVFMVIDCGANVDCKPINLLQFAVMGKVYFENILNVNNPKVGLVNIGAEEEKGNELTKSTYKLLSAAPINFAGNVEPRDIPTGDTQVIVCDGFVGNTVLKMYEGVTSNIFSILKEEIKSSAITTLGGLLLKPVFKKFKVQFDYKEYGGAPFLGVKGACIKAHGSSDARAIKNAIKQAISFNEKDILGKISQGISTTLDCDK